MDKNSREDLKTKTGTEKYLLSITRDGCKDLGVNKKITELSLKIAKIAHPISPGRRPSALAPACIYIAVNMCGGEISKRKLTYCFPTTDHSIHINCKRLIKEGVMTKI